MITTPSVVIPGKYALIPPSFTKQALLIRHRFLNTASQYFSTQSSETPTKLKPICHSWEVRYESCF